MRSVSLISLMAAACHGSGHVVSDAGVSDAGSGTVTVGTAAASGFVRVRVVDSVSKQPLAANIYLDGNAIASATLAEHATGRAIVDVTASGYFSHRRSIAVTAQQQDITIKLVPSPTTAIGAAGATVSAAEFQVVVPANAVGAGSTYASAFLDKAAVVELGPRPQFLAASDGKVHRIVSSVLFDLSTAPTQPVQITVPVPLHASSTTVTGWTMGNDGQWATPVLPISQTASTATFTTTSASTRLGVSLDLDASATASARTLDGGGDTMGSLVVSADSDATVNAAPVAAGDVIPLGANVDSGGGPCVLVDPRGDELVFGTATIATIAGCSSDCAPAAVSLGLGAGNVLVASNPSAPAQPKQNKMIIRTPAKTVGGVRGTVFDVGSKKCGDADSIDNYAVYEGSVLVDSPQGSETLGPGQSETICSSCAENQPLPICCTAYDPEFFHVVGTPTATGSLTLYPVDAGVSGGQPQGFEMCKPQLLPSLPGALTRTAAALGNDGETLVPITGYLEPALRIDTFDHPSCMGTASGAFFYYNEHDTYSLTNGDTMKVVATVTPVPDRGSGSCTVEVTLAGTQVPFIPDAGVPITVDASP